MKLPKYTIFALACVISFATIARAQATASTQATPATASAEKKADDAPSTEDKSYVEDFKDTELAVKLLDPEKKKPDISATLKKVSSEEFEFLDSGDVKITMPKDKPTHNVSVENPNLYKGNRFMLRGEYDKAALTMRSAIYPMLVFLELPEGSFVGLQWVDIYIDALIDSGRYKELKALINSLPLHKIPAKTLPIILKGIKAIAVKGDTKDALQMLSTFYNKDENAELAQEIIDILNIIRKKGAINDCYRYYRALSNVKLPEGSKSTAPTEAALWAVYCDLQKGITASAESTIKELKIDRKSDVFSLAQMNRGILKLSSKTPNYAEAIDLFAEGIVFGSMTSDWMPELLYRTGMAYKAADQKEASNAIFSQINMMYPEDSYAPKAKKEIVKIEVKLSIVQDEEDDEEDDDE